MESQTEKANSEKYDIVVYGASGFTGQFVVEELARTITEEHLTWAVAGRDKRKLQAVLATASEETGKDLFKLPIIIADVNDEASLLSMCHQANVVINCVGPYAFYGTAVVKACIESGSSHIDISGEPAWLEKTQLVFNGRAKDSGVYVLQACGFDSIPAEMGLLYTRKQFVGELNAVEAYVSTTFGSEGGSGHYGTWLSGVHGLSRMGELKNTRRQLYSSRLPRSTHPMPRRFPMFFGSHVNSWCIPLPSADKSVVFSSEYFNWTHKKQKPVQLKVFYCVPGLFTLFFMMLFATIFFVLTKFKFGISLLEKYPRLFSAGAFSHEGPTRKQMAGSSFSITFVCNGYSSKSTDVDTPHTDLPDKHIVTRVSGPEAGYVATPICAVQAAYVLLKERDKLPNGGGVLTPGAAFAETNLIDRLESHGVHFATVEN